MTWGGEESWAAFPAHGTQATAFPVGEMGRLRVAANKTGKFESEDDETGDAYNRLTLPFCWLDCRAGQQ